MDSVQTSKFTIVLKNSIELTVSIKSKRNIKINMAESKDNQEVKVSEQIDNNEKNMEIIDEKETQGDWDKIDELLDVSETHPKLTDSDRRDSTVEQRDDGELTMSLLKDNNDIVMPKDPFAQRNSINKRERRIKSEKSVDKGSDGKEVGLNHQCNQCTDPDSMDMIECSDCKGWVHYICTELPAYQLTALTKLKKSRKYSCKKCIQTDPEIHKQLQDHASTEKRIREIVLMGKIDQLKSELETAKMELEEYESTSQDVKDCIQRYKDIIEHKDKEIRAFQRDTNRFKDLLRQTGKRLDNSEAEKNELMGILQVEREHFIHEKEKIKEDAEKRIKQIESDNQIARYLQKSEESDRVRYSQKSEESDRVRYSQKSEESDRVRYSQKTEEPKTICQMYQRGYCARGEYCPDIHSYRSSPQTGQEAKDSKPYQEYQGGARHKIWKNTNSPARSDISNHSNKDQDKKEKMITHEIEVPKGKAGLIVGKGGKTVQRIQRNSLAEIESPEYGKNTFKLHGTVKQIRQAIDEMHEVLKNPGIDDQGMKDQECEICTVPVDKVGLVIGKQGHKILNIQDVTNTVIIAPAMGKEDFKIFGNMNNIKKAKELILQSIEIFHAPMSSLLQQAKSETVSKLPTTLDESMPRPRYQSQIESLPTSLGMSPDAGLDRFNRNANRDENRDERVAKIVSAVLKEMEKK